MFTSMSAVKWNDRLLAGVLLMFAFVPVRAQQTSLVGDSLVVTNSHARVVVNIHSGKVTYRFTSGVAFENTVATARDIVHGNFASTDFPHHSFTTDDINDPLGKAVAISLVHEGADKPVKIIQYITVYASQPFILVSSELAASHVGGKVESRNISPLTILPSEQGRVLIPGSKTFLTDYPFDNDNWVDVVSRSWSGSANISGTSFELISAYDEQLQSGFAVGSLVHDFWKTGIQYGSGTIAGQLDSMIIYGGAATRDNPSLPDSYGGRDGTHDYVDHGTQAGTSVYSPLMFLSASSDIRQDLLSYGNTLSKIAGRRSWNKEAPFYWNSFGVEGVLGNEKVMMPNDVAKVSDFIASMKNFSAASKPVLSVDSYDQGIYTTEVLKSISRYGKKKGQQMGFYFIPFALWTWKSHIDNATLTGTSHPLNSVILRDNNGKYIPYKDGEWGAFPIDPTHPATRDFIIGQLQKAKAIDAKFIKIDFLSAGALESATRYNPAIRSGKQAYDYGMKMLKGLIDSILGPDIFITQAISPLFPHQYAHTRFLSTDVYSHLRNDMPPFPHYGSTAASMISATHFWWTQGTLWPVTNMDVTVMKNFQKQPDIPEKDIRVRLYTCIVLGSMLGDGSDYRNKIAAERARRFLDNPAVCSFFQHPKAFTPLNFPQGTGQSQQLGFYLAADTIMAAAFNFDLQNSFKETFEQVKLNWKNTDYSLQDFLTGKEIGTIKNGQTSFTLTVEPGDAIIIKLIPVAH